MRSHLEYCSALYLPVAKTSLKKLDVTQKEAARIITHLPRDADAELPLTALRLAPLGQRRDEHALKIIDSSIAGECHPIMNSMFKAATDNSVAVETSRTRFGRRRFRVVGAALLNSRRVSQLADVDPP